MSDKTVVLTVVLDKEYRVDDMEDSLIPAIKLLKGVAEVKANVADYESYAAYARARHNLEMKLWSVLKPEYVK